MKPILPNDIKAIQDSKIPDEVIEVFNEFIIREFNGKYAILNQYQVAEAVSKKLNMTTAEIYNNKWMDIENIFNATGKWKVTYDRPAYFESHDPTYNFTAI